MAINERSKNKLLYFLLFHYIFYGVLYVNASSMTLYCTVSEANKRREKSLPSLVTPASRHKLARHGERCLCSGVFYEVRSAFFIVINYPNTNFGVIKVYGYWRQIRWLVISPPTFLITGDCRLLCDQICTLCLLVAALSVLCVHRRVRLQRGR